MTPERLEEIRALCDHDDARLKEYKRQYEQWGELGLADTGQAILVIERLLQALPELLAALDAAPQWKPRPDAPGLWLSNSKNGFANTVREEDGRLVFSGGTPIDTPSLRSFIWFGPIPSPDICTVGVPE